ncbi:MAG: Gfo/Idh/MocA family oxidoreductase [Chloroflexi bacterium]|jgi:predicted dehydrogenase|nr:Gfo/Idh/MocA family oxidoreductase [Chloroflexota bacterium]
MTPSIVNAGIVGLGLAARAHLKGYQTHPHAQVGAVCDLDRERAMQFAAEHGIPRVYTSYEELLADPDINTVDIATPTHLHAEMTRQAALAGKHIHCEKPFCRNLNEGMQAVAAVRQQGVKLVVGETYVFISSHQKARELIAAGEIGRPLQVRQRHGAWLERQRGLADGVPVDRSWRVDPVKSGGGEYYWIFDHAVHFFATAEYLMLDQPVAEVYAVNASNRALPAKSGAAHDPYTTAEVDLPIITWKYADPACQGVWMRAERLNGKYDYMRGFCTTVCGEKGMLEVLGEGGHNLLWNGQQQHLILHREGREPQCWRFDEGGDDVWESDIAYYSQGHIHQVHHLIDCILSDQEPRYTGENGVHSVQCTLAAIRSAREGRPVRLEEIDPAYTAYGSGR